MKDIERLEEKEVPLIARAWIHNGEILGITREGNLLLVAKIVGEQEDSLFNPIPEPPKKARSHKKKDVPSVTIPIAPTSKPEEE
jgi:hypothetical protein